MKNQFIAVNGKLETLTKKQLKETIEKLGNNFQQEINSKTTIVINGKEPTKKKKQKIKILEEKGKTIKQISEQEFFLMIKPKKQLPEYIKLKNLKYIIALIIAVYGLSQMISPISKLIFALAAFSVLPVFSDKVLKKLVFKILFPLLLIIIGVTLNVETTINNIYGEWYADTMSLNIKEKESKIDVIDENGRHILKGENKFANGRFKIKTEYKTFEYNYDAINDSLCIIKNDECKYYLKRVS
ncbi:MAG: BRCT domain-containing protein [Bacilli bacterium]